MAEFVFKLANNEMVTFTDWYDIPDDFSFKHVIKFMPDPLPDPHTEEEHEEMEQWNDILQKLMEKERAGNM